MFMVEIRAFQGYVFDAERTGSLDNVLTPPYDVINKDERAQLAASSPYNMTHLMLPTGTDTLSPYAQAAAVLTEWRQDGALKQDEDAHIYVLRQRFKGLDGAYFERRGFFALLRLPEQDEKFVLGHEYTFDRPVEDRLALMSAVQGNVEPIFLMYTDTGLRVTDQLFDALPPSPDFTANTSDGSSHEVWRAPCSDALKAHLRDQVLYIADGHHRFRTACLYRDACRAEGKEAGSQDFVLAGFVPFEDKGLKIYAAHRIVPASFSLSFEELVSRLEPWFDITEGSLAEVEDQLSDSSAAGCTLAVYAREQGARLLTLKEEKRQALLNSDRHPAWCNLDVAVLHKGVLDRLLELPASTTLFYEQDMHTATALVDEGKGSFAFLMRSTRPEQVRACAEAHEPMPQKSTYFFPKLPSGAVMHLFS